MAAYLLLSCSFVAAQVVPSPVTSASSFKPNIVVLLADDMGYSDLGFRGGHVPTPNLDRLVKDGVYLDQFYVQPVCTPTRACLLTGRYPFRTGTVIRFTGEGTGGMLEDERTLANALQEAGYFTAIVGKWHLGNWEQRFLPLERGFMYQYGHYSALVDYFTHERGGKLDWHRNEQPLREEGYSTFLIAKEAAKLIRSQDGVKPFFLYVPFNAVHGPQAAPPEVVAKYRDKGNRAAVYDAVLDCMDVAVGQILAALDDRGLRKKTVVLFFNDNGAPTYAKNAPLRGGKSSYFEGGIRVPAILSWPGVLKAGQVVREPLHVVDMYPTFIKLAGGSLKQPLPIDGRDAWPTIVEGKPSPHEEIVHSLDVIRRGDWKYIDARAEYYDWKAGESFLFHIKEDPCEKQNLVEKHPEIAEQLRERLKYWAKQERPTPRVSRIPKSATIYGEEENAKFGGKKGGAMKP
jgi:arylsulfatase A-like enzyme